MSTRTTPAISSRPFRADRALGPLTAVLLLAAPALAAEPSAPAHESPALAAEPSAPAHESPALAAEPSAPAHESPALRRIEEARQRIERATTPAARADGLATLAAAHTARARETGDAIHYEHALAALDRAAEIDAARADLARLEAWARLGRHEFARAEAVAAAQVARHPDDHEAWGLLGDARMELGREDEAADAYQRMIDLRPGPGAWLRASYYRERIGDPETALALLERTLVATPAGEREQRAWLLVQMAALEERLGRPARCEERLAEALRVFPDYHYALSALARHHLEQARPGDALPLARRALAVAPHAERWLTLADALRGLGDEAGAQAAEDAFLEAALANVDAPDNENLFLVDFYLDRRPDPERALELARREAARRRDPATLERLARAEALAP